MDHVALQIISDAPFFKGLSKDAIKKGILALIVAIIAQLDLTIAPFWIVFTLAVSFEGYV